MLNSVSSSLCSFAFSFLVDLSEVLSISQKDKLHQIRKMVAQQLRLLLSLTMVNGGNFLKLLCAS